MLSRDQPEGSTASHDLRGALWMRYTDCYTIKRRMNAPGDLKHCIHNRTGSEYVNDHRVPS